MHSKDSIDPKKICDLFGGSLDDILLAKELLTCNRIPWKVWRVFFLSNVHHYVSRDKSVILSLDLSLKRIFLKRYTIQFKYCNISFEVEHFTDIKKALKATGFFGRFWYIYYTFLDKIKYYVFKFKEIRRKRS